MNLVRFRDFLKLFCVILLSAYGGSQCDEMFHYQRNMIYNVCACVFMCKRGSVCVEITGQYIDGT